MSNTLDAFLMTSTGSNSGRSNSSLPAPSRPSRSAQSFADVTAEWMQLVAAERLRQISIPQAEAASAELVTGSAIEAEVTESSQTGQSPNDRLAEVTTLAEGLPAPLAVTPPNIVAPPVTSSASSADNKHFISTLRSNIRTAREFRPTHAAASAIADYQSQLSKAGIEETPDTEPVTTAGTTDRQSSLKSSASDDLFPQFDGEQNSPRVERTAMVTAIAPNSPIGATTQHCVPNRQTESDDTSLRTIQTGNALRTRQLANSSSELIQPPADVDIPNALSDTTARPSLNIDQSSPSITSLDTLSAELIPDTTLANEMSKSDRPTTEPINAGAPISVEAAISEIPNAPAPVICDYQTLPETTNAPIERATPVESAPRAKSTIASSLKADAISGVIGTGTGDTKQAVAQLRSMGFFNETAYRPDRARHWGSESPMKSRTDSISISGLSASLRPASFLSDRPVGHAEMPASVREVGTFVVESVSRNQLQDGMTVELDHPELGLVRLKATIEDGLVRVSIQTQQEQTAFLLLGHKDGMQQMLNEAGITQAHCDVAWESDPESERHQQPNHPHQTDREDDLFDSAKQHRRQSEAERISELNLVL